MPCASRKAAVQNLLVGCLIRLAIVTEVITSAESRIVLPSCQISPVYSVDKVLDNDTELGETRVSGSEGSNPSLTAIPHLCLNIKILQLIFLPSANYLRNQIQNRINDNDDVGKRSARAGGLEQLSK